MKVQQLTIHVSVQYLVHLLGGQYKKKFESRMLSSLKMLNFERKRQSFDPTSPNALHKPISSYARNNFIDAPQLSWQLRRLRRYVRLPPSSAAISCHELYKPLADTDPAGLLKQQTSSTRSGRLSHKVSVHMVFERIDVSEFVYKQVVLFFFKEETFQRALN